MENYFNIKFEKEEKVIYSNDLPNRKYTFIEQEK